MAKAKLIRRVPSNIPPRGPFANANIQAVQASVNTVDDTNVVAGAEIQRAKLASTEPEQVAFQNTTGSPFTVASSTVVTNLNADTVDGREPGSAGGIATLDASSEVVERLSYEGAANGVATLGSDSKLEQDAKTLDGKIFARASVDVTITSGTTKGTEAVLFSGFTTVSGVFPAVQEATTFLDAERPFDVGVDSILATGCNVSVIASAAVGADRTITVALLVYGTGS